MVNKPNEQTNYWVNLSTNLPLITSVNWGIYIIFCNVLYFPVIFHITFVFLQISIILVILLLPS